MVTNKGYGIVWDNPSSTTIYPAFDGETRWTSTLGRRVSFFVIAGSTTDEIYDGYRLLTGTTPMLPKAAYGFIQCKQRYSTQAEVLAVAKGYRDRHLPLDVIVVDWFYYTKMGEYDFDPEAVAGPGGMNKQLHAENIESDDQRLAAFRARLAILRLYAQQGLVRTLSELEFQSRRQSRLRASRSMACPTIRPGPTLTPLILTRRNGGGS